MEKDNVHISLFSLSIVRIRVRAGVSFVPRKASSAMGGVHYHDVQSSCKAAHLISLTLTTTNNYECLLFLVERCVRMDLTVRII